MAKLSEAAKRLIEDADVREYADDFIVIGNIGVTVLLSHRAVADLNRQARYRATDDGVVKTGERDELGR